MTEITARASLREGVVAATLVLGDAELTLTYKRNDSQASDDAIYLVENAEDTFTTVLEALVYAAEEQEKKS